ncbi:MAG: hypothetical protein Kow00120_17120 [Anaerolineae bacterium]
MLTQLHVLLSYKCIFACDHCFVFSGPDAEGAFTLSQMRQVFDEAEKIGTVDTFYFEGGEAFLFYPLLLESVRMARARGFKVGIVTNAYFATSDENAELWLRPLAELGIADFSVSDDAFHFGEEVQNAAKRARAVAGRLGMPAASICIEAPRVEAGAGHEKGAAIIGGDVVFRGRAVETLAEGLPRTAPERFTECPFEDLQNPERVHLDPYGHVHLCQGVSMGNMWATPLAALVRDYDPAAHPISGPLLRGGPAALAQAHGVSLEAGYVDACHLCYETRRALLDRFPQYLAPGQVYGLA